MGLDKFTQTAAAPAGEKQPGEMLRIREAEYRLAVEHSGKLVYRYTVADKAIDISPAAAALFGHSPRVENVPESLIEQDSIAPESVETVRHFFAGIDRGEKTGSMQARRRVSDGTNHWFDARFSTVFNDAGEPVSAIILFEDTTAAREEEIADSLDKRRLIVALRTAYPIAISINLTKGSYKTLGGDYLFMPEGSASTGMIDDLLHAEARQADPEYADELIRRFETASLLRKFKAGVNSTWMEYRRRARDKAHWVEIMALRVKNNYDSDVVGIILCRPIDEQKATEEKLQQALEITSGELSKERQYQSILNEFIPVGTLIYRLGEPLTLLHMGGTMLQELGYTREEFEAFQKNQFQGFVLEADYGTAFRPGFLSAKDPAPQYEQEYRVRKKDGSAMWLYEKATLIRMEDGARAYVVVCLDVTNRMEMEERLRASEEEMRLAMSQMGKMICVFDPAQRTLTLPETYAKDYGAPSVLPDVPESIGALGIFTGQALKDCRAFYEAILRGEKTGAAEWYIRRADGTYRWERAEFSTVFALDGRPFKAIIAIEDTTQEHQEADQNRAIRESERMLRMVAAHSNRQICRYDIATKTAYADTSASCTGGMKIELGDPEEMIIRGLVLPESVADYRRLFREMEAGAPDGSARVHLIAADGKPHWADMRYSLIYSDEAQAGRPGAAVISFLDISEDHEKELAYKRYWQMLSNDTLGERLVYFETDLTADVVEKQGGNIPGLDFPPEGCKHEAAVGYGINNLVAPEKRTQAWAFFAREHLMTAFADGIRSLAEDWPAALHGAGEYWFRSEIQMIQDPYSGHIKAYTILRDVTEEIRAAMDVKKQAETDGLTGIYNKTTAETLIRERLAIADGGACALLLVDLDDLKAINDNLGHAQGDRALRQIAGVLREQFRRTDVVGRIGGDEFLVFLDGLGSETKMHSMMIALMKKLTALRLGEKDDIPMHGSIGVAFGKAGEDDFDELYRKADKALYYVKRSGKNDYAFYTPDMEQAAYEHAGHGEASLWQVEAMDRAELNRLLYAVSAIYPLVISVNLTQNSYYMMQYNHFTTSAALDAGVFDELIADGAKTFHPEDREGFLRAFSRQNLLAAWARGEKLVGYTGRQMGDDGVYRNIRTDVIFVHGETGEDVMEITLAREVPAAT